jgi:small subunit ribosomal protein S16
MVRIRLRRTGKKKQPSYRVVVADSESPRDGRFIENIGFYNPRTDPMTFEIKADRALYWLSQGAQPSDAVARLLRKKGILQQFAAMKGGKSLDEVLAEPVAAPVEAEQVEGAEEEEAEPAAEAEVEVEPEAEAEPTAEVEAEVEPEAEAEPTAEAEVEVEPEVEAEPTAEVEAEGAPVAETE